VKGLNLDGFKKIQEDAGSATFEHGRGHKITVAKSALSEKMREHLKTLPLHSYAGNEIQDPNAPPPEQQQPFDVNQMVSGAMNPQAIKQPTPDEHLQSAIDEEMKSRGMIPGFSGNEGAEAAVRAKLEPIVMDKMLAQKNAGAEKSKEAQFLWEENNKKRLALGLTPAPPMPGQQPVQPTQPVDPNQQPNQQPLMPPQQSNVGDKMYMSGLAKEQKAIGMQQDVEIERAKREEIAQNEYADQVSYINKQYQQTHDHVMQQREHFMKDIEDGHIDPNRYLNNMGIGKRLSSAIGLVLGGMGGGMTGQENPALKFLNQQIDNDIKSQMKDIDKKQNLLSATAEQLRDNHSAALMLKANASDALSLKFKQAANQTADPAARARALMASGMLDRQSADAVNQIGNRGAQAAVMQLAGSGKMSPAMVSQLPKEMRELYVPGYGMATTPAGAQEANKKVASFKNSQDGIAQLIALAKRGSSLSPEDYTKAGSIANLLKGSLREAIVGPGAVSESERAMIDQVVSNPLAISSLKANSITSLQTLHQRLGSNLKNELSQFLGGSTRGNIKEAPPMLRK
jgi:hypothetical protein